MTDNKPLNQSEKQINTIPEMYEQEAGDFEWEVTRRATDRLLKRIREECIKRRRLPKSGTVCPYEPHLFAQDECLDIAITEVVDKAIDQFVDHYIPDTPIRDEDPDTLAEWLKAFRANQTVTIS